MVRVDDGSYSAQAGKEVVDTIMHIELKSGRILSAEMHNPLQYIVRNCSDAFAANCDVATKREALSRETYLAIEE